MSRLDDELLEAVKESEAVAVVPAPVALESKTGGSKRRNVGLLIGLLAIGGGILTLVMTGFDDAAIYSRDVDQLVREKDKLLGRNLRVQGMLVNGTLVKRDEPCEYRFQLSKGTDKLPVRFAQCVVPDNFRDVPGLDVAVTAEGTLDSDGYFQASHIVTKCPSKYEMDEKARKGERKPHMDLPATPRAL